jgi:hypothetical protein
MKGTRSSKRSQGRLFLLGRVSIEFLLLSQRYSQNINYKGLVKGKWKKMSTPKKEYER